MKEKVIRRLAILAAKVDANTSCPYIIYQPKMPDAVEKMSRINHGKDGNENEESS